MKKTNDLPLAELKFEQVVAEWKRQRRLFIIALKERTGMSNHNIGVQFNISRQAVGMIIKGKL